MKPRNLIAAAVLVLGPILMVVAFLQRRPSEIRPFTDAIAPETKSEAVARPIERALASVDRKSWHDTQQRLGKKLSARFEQGRLLEMSGTLDDGERAKGFDPSSKVSVVNRAREVARWIGPYVGVPQDQWSSARVVTGTSSAQVYFEQSRDGLPLLPAGVVSMDFGPDGQLLSLTTRLFPDVQIQGEEKIPHTLAESIAREGSAANMPSLGGRRVLWVPHPDPSANQTLAYRAYEFFVGPKQILVNATTGHVISSRDRGIR